MNELVYLKKNEMYTDSLKVAEIFQKRHDDVVRSVEKLIKRNEEFVKTRYKDEQGRMQTKYLMNRDGFSLLVMGFKGKKALEWKLKYIGAFNQREAK